MGVERDPGSPSRLQLRPEGPTFNSRARESVVATVSVNLEARGPGPLMPSEVIDHCLLPHLRRLFVTSF